MISIFSHAVRIITGMPRETSEDRMKIGVEWIGSPARLRKQIESYDRLCGGLEMASFQVNFHYMPVEEGEDSMRLFGKER